MPYAVMMVHIEVDRDSRVSFGATSTKFGLDTSFYEDGEGNKSFSARVFRSSRRTSFQDVQEQHLFFRRQL